MYWLTNYIMYLYISSMVPKKIPHVIKRGVEEKIFYTHALSQCQ